MSKSLTHIDLGRRRLWAVLTYVGTLAVAGSYCLLFLGVPPASWRRYLPEAVSSTRANLSGLIRTAYVDIGVPSWGGWELRECTYLILFGGIAPWLVLVLCRRGWPGDLGFRRPNRLAWRAIVVGVLIALPGLVWLALTPTLPRFYLPHLRRAGAVAFSLYYLCSMLSEHFVIHGLLLAVFRRGFRWPAPPVDVEAKNRLRDVGVMRWLGLAQPTGEAGGVDRITRWLGLPDGCLGALVGSTAVFSLVHLGKDPLELLLSVPGGMALAYLAYRTNSWLTPFVLHLATAGIVCLLMVWTD